MKKIVIILVALGLAVSVHAGGKQEGQDRTLKVFVSIPPQQYFVEKIGGDLVSVESLLKASGDPHTFQPRPQQVTALSRADVYFTVGISLEEGFIDTIESNLPALKIVDSSEDVSLIPASGDIHDDEHGEEGEDHDEHGEDEGEDHDEELEGDEHHHDSPWDPHYWLGPQQVLQAGLNILDTLIALRPGDEQTFRANYADFSREVMALSDEISEKLAPFRGRAVFVYHPAFGYFTESFWLEQRAIEIGGKEPTPRQIQSVVEEALAEDVHTILVQPQFSQNAGKAIATAIGGTVVSASALEYDWEQNMRKLADAVEKGLKKYE